MPENLTFLSVTENLKTENQYETLAKELILNSEQFKSGSSVLSPFSWLKESKSDKKIAAREMSIKDRCLFPMDNNLSSNSGIQIPYNGLGQFKKAIQGKEDNAQVILTSAQKYLSNIGVTQTGVSLFDYARLATATAHCLEKNNGSQNFTLIKGDISGIQEFIFDIISDGAAKTLKARSFRVQMLSKLSAHLALKKLDLPIYNLILDGGGNFYILAPNGAGERIDSLKTEINTWLFKHFPRESLNVHLGYTTFSDFKDFSNVWINVAKALTLSKAKPLNTVGMDIFKPLDAINKTTAQKKEQESYEKISDNLRAAIGWKIVSNSTQEKNILGLCDLKIEFVKPGNTEQNYFAFNNHDNAFGCSYLVKDIPIATEELWDYYFAIKAGGQIKKDGNGKKIYKKGSEAYYLNKPITFKHLANMAFVRTGSEKLGVLKMDIDHLGALFQNGLKHHSLVHVAALSRTLNWFFEGYMNTLLEKKWIRSERYKDHIYTIFSGGDDFLIVGGWDAVLDFALLLKNEFCKFTADLMTISAGYVMVNSMYPAQRFADLADDAEATAKNYRLSLGFPSMKKNCINLWGYTLKWEDMATAEKIKNTLKELKLRKDDKKEDASLYQKILRGLKVIKNFYDTQSTLSLNQTQPIIPVWKLRYSLREPKHKENMAQIESDIIELYEKDVDKLLAAKSAEEKEKTPNPYLYAIAARWTELLVK